MKGHVLITGANGGLGSVVTAYLLQKDWQLTAPVRSRRSENQLKEKFPKAVDLQQLQIVRGDITSENDIIKAVKGINHLDALVHLAGGFAGAGNIAENSAADFQSIVRLNAFSTFLLLRTVMPLFKKQKKGSIVAIGAKPAWYPNGQNAAYAASKAALINLILSVSEEGRATGVRANVIVPAVIDTPENRKWADEQTPTAKWTSPEDIAQTIDGLISDEGKAITGSIIPMFNKMKAV